MITRIHSETLEGILIVIYKENLNASSHYMVDCNYVNKDYVNIINFDASWSGEHCAPAFCYIMSNLKCIYLFYKEAVRFV